MKFMKLGTRPDTFYTEEATRSISLDVPSDLVILVGNTKYLLHKFPVLSKCGLLQQLCSESNDYVDQSPIELQSIPGGEIAFELCVKFCYGITITLSAHNFVWARCASHYLKMTEETEKGNLIEKLEGFFYTCILHGWKDSILTMQMTKELPIWSENIGITGQCIDAITKKILTPQSKVEWSFTYTRPGYAGKPHRSVPKDWWTEDISDLDIDLFRRLISALQFTKKIPPPLIGEALHVYASRWLPENHTPNTGDSQLQAGETAAKQRRILETIATMIPPNRDSVSGRFLLRLLKVANFLASSASIIAELLRRAGQKLDEATVNDLLIPSRSVSNSNFYDVDLVRVLLENFFMQSRDNMPEYDYRRGGWPGAGEFPESVRSRGIKVGRLIDGYLKVVAGDANITVDKFVALAEAVPGSYRPEHDDLYGAIDVYLKLHPKLSKTERKRVCQVLDCRKLSPDVRMHAVRNERLPLRVVVQVLFLEQEGAPTAGRRNFRQVQVPQERVHRRKPEALIKEGSKTLPARESEQKQVESVTGGGREKVESTGDDGRRRVEPVTAGDDRKSSKFDDRGGGAGKDDGNAPKSHRKVARKRVGKEVRS